MNASEGPGRRAHAAYWTGCALALVMAAGLGVLWWTDRRHPWEEPRWDVRHFTRLSPPPPADPGGPLWVVIANPLCSHCKASLSRTRVLGDSARPRPQVRALLVDTARRPDRRTVASLEVADVWWDGESRWRRRWGHRVYGEVLVFDRTGRYVRTLSPRADPERR